MRLLFENLLKKRFYVLKNEKEKNDWGGLNCADGVNTHSGH